MSLLVRKIENAKWRQNDILHGADVSADAITICMRTKANNLSVWNIDSEGGLDDAALAIISGGDHVETIWLAAIERESVANSGIELVQSQGKTAVDDLKDTHFDLINLTYPKLGFLARFTSQSFVSDRVKCYTESRLVDILDQAIRSSRLDPTNLGEHIQNTLKKRGVLP